MRLQDYDHGQRFVATLLATQRITPAGGVEVRELRLELVAPDFRATAGQSVGVIVPGPHAHGHAHHFRLYSLAADCEPDASGRRRPVPIEGSEFQIDLDTVIIAIGNGANPLIRQTTEGLEFNKWGNIIVEEDSGKTSMDKVYAGGDIVLGAATVILAMGEGRRAAKAINEQLAGS